jgi:radical SAM protein with 4Fe4S-binding SPASM domain
MKMTNLKRIRLDLDGLIVQDQKGRMKRLSLSKDEVNLVKINSENTLKILTKKYKELNSFFKDNILDATVDIVCEKSDCLNRPLRIYYGIEPRCNLECSFCGPRDYHDEFKPASEEQENFLLKEIANAGSFQIQLTGGEIGIRGYDLLNVIKKTKELGLAVILSTNGVWSCIDKKEDFLKELSSYDNIIQTKISIEGSQKFHDSVRSIRGKGTYKETVDTLAKLSEYGLNPRISTTIFKSSCNIKELEHLVSLAQKYSAGFQPIPLRPIGKASVLHDEIPLKEDLIEYTRHATMLRKKTGVSITFNFDIFEEDRQVPIYDLHRPVSCGAPLWGVHITHTGEVYPCGFVQEADKEKTFLAGTITSSKSLLDIWLHSEVLKNVRYAGKSKQCKLCNDYGKGCWGGCWVVAWVETGKINGMDPYCLKY